MKDLRRAYYDGKKRRFYLDFSRKSNKRTHQRNDLRKLLLKR